MEDVFDINLAALSYAIEVCELYKPNQRMEEHRESILATASLFAKFITLGGNTVSKPVVSLVPHTDEIA